MQLGLCRNHLTCSVSGRVAMNSVLRKLGPVVILLAAASLALAAPKPVTPQIIPPFPGTLVNARFVYVTSYDGDQFNPNLLPEDRQAIATVKNERQKRGKCL